MGCHNAEDTTWYPWKNITTVQPWALRLDDIRCNYAKILDTTYDYERYGPMYEHVDASGSLEHDEASKDIIIRSRLNCTVFLSLERVLRFITDHAINTMPLLWYPRGHIPVYPDVGAHALCYDAPPPGQDHSRVR